MSKIILLAYFSIMLYIWFNAASEFLFSKNHNFLRFIGKVLFAPVWFICIFSEQGRDYLFKFAKDAQF